MKYQSSKIFLKFCKNRLSFKATTLDDELKRLDNSKASNVLGITAKTLKENVDLFSPFLLHSMNMPINSTTFPSLLKLADVTPVYKKICGTKKATIGLPVCHTQSIENL